MERIFLWFRRIFRFGVHSFFFVLERNFTHTARGGAQAVIWGGARPEMPPRDTEPEYRRTLLAASPSSFIF